MDGRRTPTLSVGGLLGQLTKHYPSETASLILSRFIDTVIESVEEPFSRTIMWITGPADSLNAQLFELNHTNLIADVAYHIKVVQSTDIIFGWQLRDHVLVFNIGTP